jgi:hypothetical protein
MRQRAWAAMIILAALLPAVQAVPIVEFPFQFREGLLWVEVTVPQSESPLNFLVDTGSGVSAINLSTAKRIGLTLGHKVPVQGVQTMLTGYWQQHLSAKVAELELPSEYLAIDLDKLSRSCHRPVDGLVGADFFRGRIVQIDFEHEAIRLLHSGSWRTPKESLPLQFRPCGMRVPISVNDRPRQWVRLDTGCATPLQWVTSDVRPDDCTRQMAVGLAEIAIPQTKTSLALGHERFTDIPTGLHQTAIFPGEAGLLGNGLISRFSTITIDGKSGRLTLGERRLEK